MTPWATATEFSRSETGGEDILKLFVASIVARKSLAVRRLKVVQDDLRVTGTLRGILEGQTTYIRALSPSLISQLATD
jgi:hypothetical protein